MSRGTLPLSRNREFAALWAGQTVSQFGTGVTSFAVPLLILGLTGSAVQAGLAGTVTTLTTVLLRLPAGVWADRVNRRRLMLVSDAGRAVAMASIPVAAALGALTVAHILAVAVVEGALGVLFGPAEAAAVRRVVAPVQVRDAVARNQVRSQIAGLLGPAVGGLVFSLGRTVPFLLDAVSYLVSFLCVFTVRTPLQDPRPGRPGRTFFVAEIREGLAVWWRDRFLRAAVSWLAGVNVVFGSIGLVILVLARDSGARDGELGVMYSLTAAGGFVGALLAPRLRARLRPGALLVAFGWAAAAAAAVIAVLRSPYLLGLTGALAFLLFPAVNAVIFGHLAATVPDRLQGRANAAVNQVTMTVAPLGPVVAGVLLDSAGPVVAAVIYAVALTVLAGIATATTAIRTAREEAGDEPRPEAGGRGGLPQERRGSSPHA